MGIDDLIPDNTKKAKGNAINAFKVFLKEEDVSLEYLKGCMLREDGAHVFVAVFDKFAMHLAFKTGRKGSPLKPNTVGQYYRQAKLWLLDQYPQLRPGIERRLLKMGSTLENYCMTRPTSSVIQKAPPCTKEYLRQMVVYLHTNACSPADYQDAALLCLLWYLFGRASDLTMIHRSNISISAGDIFFLRFVRMKTSEEQGLSLFPDDDFATCPLLAIALVLAVQDAPGAALLHQIPEQQRASVFVEPAAAIPLIDLIDHPPGSQAGVSTGDGDPGTANAEHQRSGASTSTKQPGIHSYVNRLLDRICSGAGIEERLTSHSFRRGGAQHANGSAALSSSWIFDRGAWNMTTTNKAFAYVFNTPREDHKVAKVLSGHDPDRRLPLASLSTFDTRSQGKIRAAMARLFVACYRLETAQYNVSASVLDVLMAYLVRHYPSLKQLNASSLAVKRLEDCVVATGSSLAELLAWSAHLAPGQERQAQHHSAEKPGGDAIEDHPVVRHQAALIEELVKMNKLAHSRLSALEGAIFNAQTVTEVPADNDDDNVSEPPLKRARRAQITYLKDTWYTWYASTPRLWSSADAALSKKKSDTKLLVAFMKLVLEDGFVLDADSARYRDDVIEIGAAAERGVLAILREHGISSVGSSAALEHLRTLHKRGSLNANIRNYRQLRVLGKIADPAPAHTQDILQLETEQ